MKQRKTDQNYLLRLEKGELLIETITSFVVENGINGAWINGLGGAQWAELGFYKLDDKSYVFKKMDELLEITSLQGNIAWENDAPVVHLHGTFSDESMRAYGGHIKELSVAGTCELLISNITNEKIVREKSELIGLKLLQL